MQTQPAHEIIPRVWLGNRRAAHDVDWLTANNINMVMNCSKDIPFASDTKEKRRLLYRIAVDDSLKDEDINFFTQSSEEVAYTLVREYNAGRRILIHCMAGMQRSACAMALFLMTLNRWTAQQAINYIQSIRAIAFTPGVNFMPTLQYYEQKLFSEIIPAIDSYGYMKEPPRTYHLNYQPKLNIKYHMAPGHPKSD